MRAFDFFGPDGESYRLGHVAETHREGDLWERMDAGEAIRVLRSAAAVTRFDGGLARLWEVVHGGGGFDDAAPATIGLVGWASSELARPAGVLALWRAPRRRLVAGATEAVGEGPLLSDLAEPEVETTWVAFRLLDLHGEPIADVRYELTLSDGSTQEGSTDGNGEARHDGIVRGGCVLVFPDLPESYWENAHNAE